MNSLVAFDVLPVGWDPADRCGAMTPLDGESDSLERPAPTSHSPVQVAGEPGHVAGEEVPPTELNAWRRGFTPQAEIWNGRLAMVGLSVGLSVLLVARLASR